MIVSSSNFIIYTSLNFFSILAKDASWMELKQTFKKLISILQQIMKFCLFCIFGIFTPFGPFGHFGKGGNCNNFVIFGHYRQFSHFVHSGNFGKGGNCANFAKIDLYSQSAILAIVAILADLNFLAIRPSCAFWPYLDILAILVIFAMLAILGILAVLDILGIVVFLAILAISVILAFLAIVPIVTYLAKNFLQTDIIWRLKKCMKSFVCWLWSSNCKINKTGGYLWHNLHSNNIRKMPFLFQKRVFLIKTIAFIVKFSKFYIFELFQKFSKRRLADRFETKF